MNIGESYSIPLDERNLQGMTLHRTSRAPSLSPVPTNSSFPFQPPEATTAEVTGIFILTVLMLFVGAFAICSALCRSTRYGVQAPCNGVTSWPVCHSRCRTFGISPLICQCLYCEVLAQNQHVHLHENRGHRLRCVNTKFPPPRWKWLGL